MTNQEFGKRVGVSHSMASRMRMGLRLPSVAVMRQIHREFGIPLVELVEAHTEGGEAMAELLKNWVFEPKPRKPIRIRRSA